MFDAKPVDVYATLSLQLKPAPTANELAQLAEALAAEPLLKIPETLPMLRIRRRSVTRALLKAARTYRVRYHKPVPHYGSEYWNIVFEEYFGRPPKGNDDPEWDRLLFEKGGLGALTRAEKIRERFPKSGL